MDATVQELLRPAQSRTVGGVRQVVPGAGKENDASGGSGGEVVPGAGTESPGKGGGTSPGKSGGKGDAAPSGDGKPRIIPGEAPPKAKKRAPLVEVETKYVRYESSD